MSTGPEPEAAFETNRFVAQSGTLRRAPDNADMFDHFFDVSQRGIGRKIDLPELGRLANGPSGRVITPKPALPECINSGLSGATQLRTLKATGNPCACPFEPILDWIVSGGRLFDEDLCLRPYRARRSTQAGFLVRSLQPLVVALASGICISVLGVVGLGQAK